MADGYITIETKLSTNKFDKQVTDLEKKIKDEENKSELKLKAKLQAEDELERHKQKILEIEQEYEKTSQQVEHLQNIMSKQAKGISLTPQEFTDLQGSEKVIANNEKIGETLDKMYAKEVKLNNAVDRTTLAYKQTKDNVTAYKTKIESVNIQKQQAQLDQLKNGFKKMNTSVSSSIKHIGRLALGIFSVASAYRLMSAASSTLGQYDKQYATNLEYIRYLIAQAIAPALKYVVNLASTLLSYLNYILNAWFGITLFSKNSAKNFMNAKNSTGGISKNTGKIKKDLQTTPFDEMNILTDTSDSGTSGGAGGGAIAPSIDPSMLQGEVPDWLKWIADNKDLILSIMAGITAGLLAWKLGLDGIKALGIGLLIAGIVYAVESLIEYLKDPSWENFGKIITGIGIALMGLGLIIGGPAGLPVIIAGAITAILGLIISNWDKIKSFLQSGIDWLKGQGREIFNWLFGDIFMPLYDGIVNILQDLLNWFNDMFTNIKNIFDNIIAFIKNVFTGNWEGAWNNIKNIFISIWNIIQSTFLNVISIIKNIVVGIGQTAGNIIAGVFKAVVNAVLRTIENILNSPIRAVNSLINVINAIPGINIGRLPTFNLPRLAKGTILNAPGRGVPVAGGTALAGEAGREAYLPLSDTQLLEELGSTIGKYITINANITNTMNGRVISRQLQQIRNDREFAYNG